MSKQNNTRFLLNIKDPNIIFSDNSVRKEIVNGIECNVVTASLSPSNPKHCMHCGCINSQYSIIKNGSKTVTLRLNRCSGITTYLKLKKSRFYCKNCKRTFIDQCSLVKPNCSITTSVYHQVILDIKTKQSVLDISKRNDVSHTTINTWIHSINDSYVPSFKHLPKHLSFDEFRSVNEVKGKMSFIFMDSSNGSVLDILTHRHTGFLKSYFFRYPLKVRKKVKSVCIDMFKGYIDVIRVCFPNAVIITDRFHVVQLLNRSLNSVRVQTMNENKEHYKKLKRYWKLLLKNHEDLDFTNHKKFTGFYYLMTEQQVVDELLRHFPILEESYWLVQNLRTCIKHRNIKRFKTMLEKKTKHLPKTIQTSMDTLRYHSSSIINALTYSYSNGKLEGTNNLIKVIKRIAFGYRLFTNFRARILLICNTMVPLQI